MVKISQSALVQQSGTLILEQRAKCEKQNRVLKILYFRELPVFYRYLEAYCCGICHKDKTERSYDYGKQSGNAEA